MPRTAIRANVILAITTASALLVAVNWFGSLKFLRRDIASYGNYGMSDRAKSILSGYKDPVEVSLLYMPDDENEKQSGYISRLQDYCDEMQRYAPGVKVTHVASDSQRERLVARISTTFGGEAGKHKEALAAFTKLHQDLQADLEQRLGEAQALLSGDSWLAEFPVFANIVNTLKSDQETLKKAAEEITELTPEAGIPKFGEATTKAKTAVTEVKGHLEAVGKRLKELATLAEETTRADSRYIRMLGEVASSAKGLIASMSETVGGPDGSAPSSPAAALKAFADRSNEVGPALEGLVRRVDDFARAYPMVRQHSSWAAAVQMGPFQSRMEVADVLQQAGQAMAKSRLVMLGAIDSKDPAQLDQAMAAARRTCAALEQNGKACEQLLTELARRLSNLDPGSKAVLDAAKAGNLFGERIVAIDSLVKQVDGLPELKLGSVADRLKEDNAVVIEAAGKIRVVAFNDVWPVRESVGGPSSRSEEPQRTFNGDSALSSAILAMTREKPFATVMMVSYEPPPPQQRNQFMPGPQPSWIPSAQVSELRRRLEAANFKVLDWNLATTKEPPKGEEGVPVIHVCLPPPPPSMPSPFGPQQPEASFGEAERETIRQLLENDARVVFLGTWEFRSGGMFGGPPMTPPYGYQGLLENDWGIVVDNSRRIVWVEPDKRTRDGFGIVPRRFVHLPVMGFSDHEIGKPMKGTRFLVGDSCPVSVKAELPRGVSVATVLQLPNRENYIGAEVQDLVKIIDEVQNPSSEGTVVLSPRPSGGPFDLMLTAQRMDGEKSKGRIAVIGFGASVRDDFLRTPVWSGGDRLRLDPAPAESVDLFINTLYWLQGHPELIARGPAPVPRVLPIQAGSQQFLRVLVWGLWPALVFLPGVFLWYARRR
jgi:hypothetical protein